MADGFFLGGLASGFQKQEALNNQADYQQGILKLDQQRLQNQKTQQDRDMFFQLQKQFLDSASTTINAAKESEAYTYPGMPPDALTKKVTNAYMPSLSVQIDHLEQMAKTLGIPVDVKAQVSNLFSTPVTPSTQLGTQKTQADIEKTKAGTQLINQTVENNSPPPTPTNPELDTDTQLGGPTDANGNPIKVSAEDEVKRKYDPRTIFKAEQYLGGNTSVLTGLGYGKTGAAARKRVQDAAADLAIARNISPEQVNANIAGLVGQKRAASAAGLRVGNVTVALDAAQAASKRVLETSAKVDRTQYPSLNSIIMAARKGTGDTNVIQYGIAINTLVNNYARAMGGGNAGLTDTARKEAWDNLSLAWSSGQINAAVEQINKEIESELGGAKKAMKDVTSQPKGESGITVHGFTFTPSQ